MIRGPSAVSWASIAAPAIAMVFGIVVTVAAFFAAKKMLGPDDAAP